MALWEGLEPQVRAESKRVNRPSLGFLPFVPVLSRSSVPALQSQHPGGSGWGQFCGMSGPRSAF